MAESRRRSPGNGYPSDWRQFTLWMPKTLYDRIDAVTDRTEMSAYIREAIEEKLDRYAESEARELTADYREKMRQHRVRLAIDGGPFITEK